MACARRFGSDVRYHDASKRSPRRVYTRRVDGNDVAAALDSELVGADGGEPGSHLQPIVDEASRVLGRPVLLTDRHVRVLAYTRHQADELDRTRLMGIMKQPMGPELLAWFGRHGMWTAERPFRIPGNPELEYEPRAVAPIRFRGHHLGTLACTDRDETMSDEDLARLGAFADEAAVVLYRERLLLDLDRARERELLRDLLADDERIRQEAVWQLRELDLFVSGSRVVVLAIPLDPVAIRERAEPAGRDPSAVHPRLAVEAALMRIRRHLAPRHGLHLLRPDHALVLASLDEPGIRTEGVEALARRIRDDLAASLPATAGRGPVVAVGGVARELAGAVVSYDQALRAAKIATSVASFGDVVCWDELGVYQLLTEIPVEGLGATVLHAGLRRLLADPRAAELVPTLERFLDLAGNTQQTAASLYLHRTTLYHRLRRVEQLAEVDLHKGDDRLALHLSLKLARMQGVAWPVAVGEPTATER